MQTIERENRHFFEIMALFVIFGMIFGWVAYKQNPYSYVCVDEEIKYDIYYENCMEDCIIGKYECLSGCGCNEVETRKDNPVIELIVGGLIGITLGSVYFSFKGY